MHVLAKELTVLNMDKLFPKEIDLKNLKNRLKKIKSPAWPFHHRPLEVDPAVSTMALRHSVGHASDTKHTISNLTNTLEALCSNAVHSLGSSSFHQLCIRLHLYPSFPRIASSISRSQNSIRTLLPAGTMSVTFTSSQNTQNHHLSTNYCLYLAPPPHLHVIFKIIAQPAIQPSI